MKIFIFNAPPSSGKDEACNYIEKMVAGVTHHRFKKHLIDLTLLIHQVSQEWWDSRYTTELKNVKCAELDNQSPREALIKVSEDVIKPKYGKDYFGIAAAKLINPDVNLHIFSDGGFKDEVRILRERFPTAEITIVKVIRDGYTFESQNDSRSYISVDGCNEVTIENNADLESYLNTILNLVDQG